MLWLKRVVMGLQRAKAQGKILGRPKVSVDLQQLRELRSEGLSLRAIAKRFGVSHPTILAALNGG